MNIYILCNYVYSEFVIHILWSIIFISVFHLRYAIHFETIHNFGNNLSSTSKLIQFTPFFVNVFNKQRTKWNIKKYCFRSLLFISRFNQKQILFKCEIVGLFCMSPRVFMFIYFSFIHKSIILHLGSVSYLNPIHM